MDVFDAMAGGGGTLIFVFLFVLAILWFLLPFAVFGTKPLLRENLEAQAAILKELRKLNEARGPDPMAPREKMLPE